MSHEAGKVVDAQDVKNTIKLVGYNIVKDMGEVFIVQDESCIPIYCCVEDNVLLNSIPCHKIAKSKLTADVLVRMMRSDNGLSTSSLRLTDVGDGNMQITLTNFCKLQELGADDQDDIRSALNFLEIDVVKARDLLKDIL